MWEEEVTFTEFHHDLMSHDSALSLAIGLG